jgi:hypothetical protein
MQFSQTSRHFISPRSKYSPQHPVTQHNHSFTGTSTAEYKQTEEEHPVLPTEVLLM